MIYIALKTVIRGNNYDYESTLSKMDLFLLAGRITEEQYVELKAIMDEQRPQKPEEPQEPEEPIEE